jgi:transcriptional regulator with XRE-family HTH domain
MPLTLPAPPDLGATFWEQPEIIAAVQHEQLGQFLLAYRGARRPRWSQDQMARWLGCNQSTISDLENGRAPVTHARLGAVFTSLKVPPDVAVRWGAAENDAASRRGVVSRGLS